MARTSELEAANESTRYALSRAREAETLEQSRRALREMIAKDASAETVLTELAAAVERHSPGVVCSLEIRLSGGTTFTAAPSVSVNSQNWAPLASPD